MSNSSDRRIGKMHRIEDIKSILSVCGICNHVMMDEIGKKLSYENLKWLEKQLYDFEIRLHEYK